MYEFIILAQLMHGPSHGYLIAKVINDIIGPYAQLSSGRLYPLLAKLEENGLIAAELASPEGRQGDRQLRVYRITEAGRMRFCVLMGDTGSNPGDYRELFHLKVCYFRYIAPVERLRLIDHYLLYCQNHVFHLQSEA
ncbi:MAG: PadR family transcriptional regulator, partial [Ktedonobacteraceae bacterium]|nr:PadR family transcriptional regulator [Ktedonobacteraceae bacterium]